MQIAFIGYGDLGIQVGAFLKQQYASFDAVYFDDVLFASKKTNAYPFNDFENPMFKDCGFVICLGYKHAALKNIISKKLIELGYKHLSFIHPSCFVNETAKLGVGVICYPMCNIDRKAEIGNGVLLNNSVVVSHNCVIGDACYLSPGVVVSGNVQIGENSFLGSGSLVANDIVIGKNVVIGIGTVVTQNLPDNSFVIGNPMKFVEKINVI